MVYFTELEKEALRLTPAEINALDQILGTLEDSGLSFWSYLLRDILRSMADAAAQLKTQRDERDNDQMFINTERVALSQTVKELREELKEKTVRCNELEDIVRMVNRLEAQKDYIHERVTNMVKTYERIFGIDLTKPTI